jgi:lipopolysaccharide/colanic/teichoic acid biosynthesis glycosyltransferase
MSGKIAGMLPQRVFDVIAAALGILIISPLLILVAAAVKLQDGGPVFYRARRIGRGGGTFLQYKFRTMVPGADQKGLGITVNGDERVTPVGRHLRRFKLDELGQLFNVLKGEMSFVGPRPEDPRYVKGYTKQQRQLLGCRPGITSPASLKYRDEEILLAGDDCEEVYLKTILPDKLAIELQYAHHRTLWTDLKVILQTISRLPHGS